MLRRMQPSGSDIMAAYDRHQRAVDVQDQPAVLSRAEAVAEEFRAPGPVALVLVRASHPEHGFEAGAVRCIEEDVARIDLPPDLAKDPTLIHLRPTVA